LVVIVILLILLGINFFTSPAVRILSGKANVQGLVVKVKSGSVYF